MIENKKLGHSWRSLVLLPLGGSQYGKAGTAVSE